MRNKKVNAEIVKLNNIGVKLNQRTEYIVQKVRAV